MNKTLELFYNFLEQNKVLIEWEQNFLKLRIENGDLTRAEYFYKMLNQNTAHNLIMSAFSWSSTPQGHTYWSLLHDKWWAHYRNEQARVTS